MALDIPQSEPLLYYIFQLAYPADDIKDHYGNLLTDIASCQLTMHPVDATEPNAFIEGARSDVVLEGKEKVSFLSMDPINVIGRRCLNQTLIISREQSITKWSKITIRWIFTRSMSCLRMRRDCISLIVDIYRM